MAPTGDADASGSDTAESPSAAEGALGDAEKGSVSLDVSGGFRAVCKRAGYERLGGAGPGFMVAVGVREGVEVCREDGFTPGDGEGVRRRKHKRYRGGVVAHGGPEGDEESAFAGSDDGGGEDD